PLARPPAPMPPIAPASSTGAPAPPPDISKPSHQPAADRTHSGADRGTVARKYAADRGARRSAPGCPLQTTYEPATTTATLHDGAAATGNTGKDRHEVIDLFLRIALLSQPVVVLNIEALLPVALSSLSGRSQRLGVL